MNNIFEGKTFGDIMLTRDGRKAVFLGEWETLSKIFERGNCFKCIIEGEDDAIGYKCDGSYYGDKYGDTYCEDDDGNLDVWGIDIVGSYNA